MIINHRILIAFALGIIPAGASLNKSGVYVGTSFGVSQLFGKRSDSINFPTPPSTLNVFVNKKMEDTSLEASVFAGYRYPLCHTNFVFSIDGSFSYGPYEHLVFKNTSTKDNLNYVAILKRNVGYGVIGRAGYIIHPRLMPYVLLGVRIDRFTYTTIAADASSGHQRKMLVGNDFGAGIETCLGSLKMGIEFKYTYYHRNNRFARDKDSINFTNARPQSASLSLRFTHIF